MFNYCNVIGDNFCNVIGDNFCKKKLNRARTFTRKGCLRLLTIGSAEQKPFSLMAPSDANNPRSWRARLGRSSRERWVPLPSFTAPFLPSLAAA
jgi:uncharacterized Zn finger protein